MTKQRPFRWLLMASCSWARAWGSLFSVLPEEGPVHSCHRSARPWVTFASDGFMLTLPLSFCSTLEPYWSSSVSNWLVVCGRTSRRSWWVPGGAESQCGTPESDWATWLLLCTITLRGKGEHSWHFWKIVCFSPLWLKAHIQEVI